MNAEELIAAYKVGERNLTGADLRHADLRHADLRGANLQGADLWRADLWHANLSGANLLGANLQGANLSGADLWHADLQDADLRDADLWHANLSGANLRYANLQDADLRDADLQDADLRHADLRGANLQGADLWRANLRDAIGIELAISQTRILPDGALIGWKKCMGKVIVKLLIPENAKRTHAFGRKCRAEYADVLEVIGADEGVSQHDGTFVYIAGKRVTPEVWCDNWMQECAGGIHFYITRLEAENH
jgi:hypothetical protein